MVRPNGIHLIIDLAIIKLLLNLTGSIHVEKQVKKAK